MAGLLAAEPPWAFRKAVPALAPAPPPPPGVGLCRVRPAGAVSRCCWPLRAPSAGCKAAPAGSAALQRWPSLLLGRLLSSWSSHEFLTVLEESVEQDSALKWGRFSTNVLPSQGLLSNLTEIAIPLKPSKACSIAEARLRQPWRPSSLPTTGRCLAKKRAFSGRSPSSMRYVKAPFVAGGARKAERRAIAGMLAPSGPCVRPVALR